MARRLTVRQKKFIAAMIGEANGNATEAARLAGYRGNRQTLAQMGADNLKNPQIMEEIEGELSALRSRGIAERANRIERLDRRWNAIDHVMKSRAKDPRLKDYPGGEEGGHGILTLTPRRAWLVDDSGAAVPPSGGGAGNVPGSPHNGANDGEAKPTPGTAAANRVPIVVYEAVVDVALLKEERELARQAAIETGEWNEKAELNIPGLSTVPVVEIKVFRPVPADGAEGDDREDEDDDDPEDDELEDGDE